MATREHLTTREHLMEIRDDKSTRGTPNTVRPTVGAGTPKPLNMLAGAIPAIASHPGVLFVNPDWLASVDPARLAADPAVAARAKCVCKGLIGAQVFALVAQFGLTRETICGILREVADDLTVSG